MIKYLLDVILLTITWSIPCLVSRLRLRSSGSRKVLYDAAKDTTGMAKRLNQFLVE